MKQCVKRVYCPTCKKLVKCHETGETGKEKVICYRCGSELFTRESEKWRYVLAKGK